MGFEEDGVMYWFNKAVGALTNPVCLAWTMVLVALLLRLLRRRKFAHGLLIAAVIWTWVWATPMMSRWLGATLERACLVDGKVPRSESYPLADAIELHGGSMGVATNVCARGEMWTSADRVWTAARLWKLGKAPKLCVTGTGCADGTVALLEDFGVPTNALVIALDPRNTEEEARWVGEQVKEKGAIEAEGRNSPSEAQGLREQRNVSPKVLVVTSAWHMRRTMLMYAKYAPNVEAIPVPCDFENTVNLGKAISLFDFLPNEGSLMGNCVAFHEWVGIWGYRWFR